VFAGTRDVNKITFYSLSSRPPLALHTGLLPALDLTQAFQVPPVLLFLTAISCSPEQVNEK